MGNHPEEPHDDSSTWLSELDGPLGNKTEVIREEAAAIRARIAARAHAKEFIKNPANRDVLYRDELRKAEEEAARLRAGAEAHNRAWEETRSDRGKLVVLEEPATLAQLGWPRRRPRRADETMEDWLASELPLRSPAQLWRRVRRHLRNLPRIRPRWPLHIAPRRDRD